MYFIMRQEFTNSELWASRGFLPHYDASNKFQMITYRLADSLPSEKIPSELQLFSTPGSTGVPPVENSDYSVKRRKSIESILDKGYGSCLLAHPSIAQLVVDAWKYFDQKRYELIAYVVMPNHVHLMVKTFDNFPLPHIIHSWKSFTAHEIFKCLRSRNTGETPVLPEYRSKQVWQIEYWDRFIRDEDHFKQAVDYIHQNPVKAGLCDKVEDWKWSSAHLREKMK